MSAAELVGPILFVLAVLAFIVVTANLPHHINRRPTAIRIRFVRPGACRFSSIWRRLRRVFMDLNDLHPGETRAGTLVIVDQNGADLPNAEFDAQPALNSSDTGIVTIDGGATFKDINVTGIAEGDAQITADGISQGVQLQQGFAAVTVIQLPNGAFGIDIRF